MASDNLHITIIQPDMVWEDAAANLRQYEALLGGINGRKEVVVLPEMFSTGFSMSPQGLAEEMDGRSVQWMREMAARHRIILTGSLIIREEDRFYNRLIWMQPDGVFGQYDKRHLFGYAGEGDHYTPGSRRLITQVKGWRICPLICYDLRFPVWSRNLNADYDVLLYVANWPKRRSTAWKALLQARAIENQAYVAGVNRVGDDGNGIRYSGDSAVYSPLGEPLYTAGDGPEVQTVVLERAPLEEGRSHFPFLRDADPFLLLDTPPVPEGPPGDE
jgi:predicted amidohydrolase